MSACIACSKRVKYLMYEYEFAVCCRSSTNSGLHQAKRSCSVDMNSNRDEYSTTYEDYNSVTYQ